MRKYLLMTASLSLVAVATINVSDASAKWGCYAKTKSNGWGGSYGQDSKERAVELAIRSCKQANPKENRCSLTGCSSEIEAEADMNKKWSPPTPVKVRCGAGADKEC
jgi:hypothetical protein